MRNNCFSYVAANLFSLHGARKLLVCLSLAISSCSSTVPSASALTQQSEEGPVGLEIVAQFPAAWADKLQYAVSQFRKGQPNVGCMTVIIGRNKEVEMDFVAIGPSINLTPKGGFGRVKGCGIGVSYYFDDNGDFVRSEIQR